MNDPIDPRLVALGMVPPAATEKRPADLQEARPGAPPAPPPPPLASAMPSEAPITLSAGAIAAAQDALTVKQGRAKAEKAPKLPKAEKVAKPPKLPKAPKLPKMAKVAAEAVPFVSTLPPSAVLLRGPIAMG